MVERIKVSLPNGVGIYRRDEGRDVKRIGVLKSDDGVAKAEVGGYKQIERFSVGDTEHDFVPLYGRFVGQRGRELFLRTEDLPHDW